MSGGRSLALGPPATVRDAIRRHRPALPMMPSVHEPLVDTDLRGQRFVDGAALRDGEHSFPLLLRQIAEELDGDVETMDVAVLRQAIGAILRVHAIVFDR